MCKVWDDSSRKQRVSRPSFLLGLSSKLHHRERIVVTRILSILVPEVPVKVPLTNVFLEFQKCSLSIKRGSTSETMKFFFLIRISFNGLFYRVKDLSKVIERFYRGRDWREKGVVIFLVRKKSTHGLFSNSRT